MMPSPSSTCVISIYVSSRETRDLPCGRQCSGRCGFAPTPYAHRPHFSSSCRLEDLPRDSKETCYCEQRSREAELSWRLGTRRREDGWSSDRLGDDGVRRRAL
jgi:hypothetical protein